MGVEAEVEKKRQQGRGKTERDAIREAQIVGTSLEKSGSAVISHSGYQTSDGPFLIRGGVI